jgi:acetyl-CoA carboxylase biotin carboxyl carrier protein
MAVPSVEASSATQSSPPGNASLSAARVNPIRSASLRAATITTGPEVAAGARGPEAGSWGSPRGCSSCDTGGYCGAPCEATIVGAEVEAHITGTVWKIEVAVGDSVDEGDTVVILESMKMEMPVEAEEPGTVSEIRCEEGQSVQEGEVLVVLE